MFVIVDIFCNSHSFAKLGNLYISLDGLVSCFYLLSTEGKGGTGGRGRGSMDRVQRGPYKNCRVSLELAKLVSS